MSSIPRGGPTDVVHDGNLPIASHVSSVNRDTFHGWRSSEPIGLEYIGATLVEAGFRCRFDNQHSLLVTAYDSGRTLCFISGMTCEWAEVLEVTRVAKRKGYTTVLGGYHACGNWEDLPRGYFDHVVIGEGEGIAVVLAKVLLRNEAAEFEGQNYGSGSIPRVIHTQRVTDLNSLPFPLRSEENLRQHILFDLMWPPTSMQKNTAIVLTSRGCGHDCDFCASASVWGKGIRFRSPKNIVGELEDLKDRFETNTVIIIDQSFGQLRDWTLDVCKAIKEARLDIHWYHQSNLDIDRDVIQAMADAGCSKIGFGLEGISPRAIEKIKPFNPRNMDCVNDLFDYCNSLGLIVKAYLMIGFPWENDDIIKEYMDWIPRIRANQIKIAYMTPFPGTRYWDRYSDQLVTRDWSQFDTINMPVVYNPNVSVGQYHRIRQQLFRAFYGSRTYAETTEQLLRIRPHYVQSYIEFADYLKAHDMVSGDEAWLQSLKPCDSKTPTTEVA